MTKPAIHALRDASRRPTRGASGAEKALRTAMATALLLLAWAAAAAMVKRPFLPSPWTTLSRMASRIADGSLAAHLGASARRVGLALALAAPPAALLGMGAGRSRRLDSLVSPFVYILHPLPKVAFLPVIMLFLGLGDAAKVFLIGLIVFGQLLVSARDAAKAVPEAFVDSVRSLGGSQVALLRHVFFPATLPSLLSALRVSLGTAIAVLFLAETFASETGLGWYIVDAWTRVDYPDMYAAIVALSLFGLGCYLAIDAAEGVLCSWRKTN
jgi:ABC-type nitrate/sulfonate/bicarbonate transport system permease component